MSEYIYNSFKILKPLEKLTGDKFLKKCNEIEKRLHTLFLNQKISIDTLDEILECFEEIKKEHKK